ncbi:Endonuclease/exonuclease/phosphatase [Trema orientale]|uniref:Endonuclease/exonuclease/phosphatase n=1 Tax=Trema orientale TaxID=63057 RepID=A0A2P5F8I7_TREOI|nr:Endonuclease/exonuclease/phosphatase [Trema orientale]
MDSARMGNLWRKLGFVNAIVVSSVGMAGGLFLITSGLAKKIFWAQFTSEVMTKGRIWACIGDLNYVLSVEEKLGGSNFQTYDGSGLREFLFQTVSMDVDYSRGMFTWTDRRDLEHLVKKRLDRVVYNPHWTV